MIIPDKYIRLAIINLATGVIDTPIYETVIPKSVIPTPLTYILLSTQSKQQKNTSKCGHNWQCSIVLDICSNNQQGYSSKAVVEDIEQQLSDLIDLSGRNDIAIPPFTVLNTQMLDSHDMSYETPTLTVSRKIVRYQFILQGIYTQGANNAFTYTLPFQLA